MCKKKKKKADASLPMDVCATAAALLMKTWLVFSFSYLKWDEKMTVWLILCAKDRLIGASCSMAYFVYSVHSIVWFKNDLISFSPLDYNFHLHWEKMVAYACMWSCFCVCVCAWRVCSYSFRPLISIIYLLAKSLLAQWHCLVFPMSQTRFNFPSLPLVSCKIEILPTKRIPFCLSLHVVCMCIRITR